MPKSNFSNKLLVILTLDAACDNLILPEGDLNARLKCNLRQFCTCSGQLFAPFIAFMVYICLNCKCYVKFSVSTFFQFFPCEFIFFALLVWFASSLACVCNFLPISANFCPLFFSIFNSFSKSRHAIV